MEYVLIDEKSFMPYKMKFYTDRSAAVTYREIADQCVKGILALWDDHYLDINTLEGNIFQHKFDGNDVILKHEYLFAMDYLSNCLTAYEKTREKIYKETFEKIIDQFHEYLERNGPVYEDLAVYAQTLLIIKAYDIFGQFSHINDFLDLLMKYAYWLMDDSNYQGNNNHGLFQDLALLHISVFLGDSADACTWKRHAVKRVRQLFETAYYDDFTNNENSIIYFQFNNYMYEQIFEFCNYYGITDIKHIEERLERSKEALITFAHKDGSFPVIGDGRVFNCEKSNHSSCLFPDLGMAVLKIKETYLSFKNKTVYQSHAHVDVSSITARYKDIDFLIDSGQCNYDRYTPTNRYMRSSVGHTGIFPVFADGMFLGEFCDSLEYAEITSYECDETKAYVRGEYRLKDIQVVREVIVFPNEIKIKDKWSCGKPTMMRQRFIIPKELIENSTFTVSRRTLTSKVGNVNFKFEIKSEKTRALTVVQFGIAAPQYNSYEETMLLDTFAENALDGEISVKITFWEDE